MSLIKKKQPSKRKTATGFSKKQGEGTSFQAKITRANEILKEAVFIKKPVHN